MKDARAPFRLMMIKTCVGVDTQLTVGGGCKLKTNLIREWPRISAKVVFAPWIALCFGMEIPIFDIHSHREADASVSGQFLAEQRSARGARKAEHRGIGGGQHVCRELDFHHPSIPGAGDE